MSDKTPLSYDELLQENAALSDEVIRLREDLQNSRAYAARLEAKSGVGRRTLTEKELKERLGKDYETETRPPRANVAGENRIKDVQPSDAPPAESK